MSRRHLAWLGAVALAFALVAACVRRETAGPATGSPAVPLESRGTEYPGAQAAPAPAGQSPSGPHPRQGAPASHISTGLETAEARVAGSPRRFPNPELVDQDGQSVRFYDDLVRGRVVMVNFSYTQCTGACPRATAQLMAVQRLLGDRFGRDFTLLTLSLDPEHDTPAAMRRYLSAHGGGPGWTWLTGRREDIEAIRRFVGFTDRDPQLDADRTRHTTLVLLGNDRTGRWSSVPALIKPEQIVEALLRTAGERPAAAVAMQGACPPF